MSKFIYVYAVEIKKNNIATMNYICEVKLKNYDEVI